MALRHSCEAVEKVFKYIGLGLRDKVRVRDNRFGGIIGM